MCLSGELSLKPSLNLPRQRAKIGDTLQFVIRQLDAKMILEFGKQIKRLQAVDAQRLEEIVVRVQFFPGHFEVRGGKTQYFIQCLVDGLHSLSLYDVIANGLEPRGI
jgi:hypothetical protein